MILVRTELVILSDIPALDLCPTAYAKIIEWCCILSTYIYIYICEIKQNTVINFLGTSGFPWSYANSIMDILKSLHENATSKILKRDYAHC